MNITSIFVSTDNLANTVTLKTDVDSVKNCFRLEAGDDLMTSTIRSCNPNGSQYLWYISDITKSDMSDELRNRLNEIVKKFKRNLSNELKLDEELIANYVIKVSYNNFSISKSFAWAGYADYIIKNLKNNSNPRRNISIVEVPYKTNNSYEYLGKFYEFKAVNDYR